MQIQEGMGVRESLEETLIFLQERLSKIGEQVKFTLSIMDENEPPNPRGYKKIGKIYAKKFDAKEWRAKLRNIISSGASDENIMTSFGSINRGVDCNQYLIAVVYFQISAKLRGEMEYIREYNHDHDIVMKEYVVIQYRIDFMGRKHGFVEISATWEDAARLLGMSAMDFEREPEHFISERILKFKKLEKVNFKPVSFPIKFFQTEA